MPDVITAEERKLIDQAIAMGRVKVIPRGVESIQAPDYRVFNTKVIGKRKDKVTWR